MRRQSLALDAQVAAAAAAVALAAAARSKGRRGSQLLSDTVHVGMAAVKHITLRALQSRPRTAIEPSALSQTKYRLPPLQPEKNELCLASKQNGDLSNNLAWRPAHSVRS